MWRTQYASPESGASVVEEHSDIDELAARLANTYIAISFLD